MQKADAERLQNRIVHLPNVRNAQLFYVDEHRIYAGNEKYEPQETTEFRLEIRTTHSKLLHPTVLREIADAELSLRHSLVTSGLFRTGP